MLIRDRSERSRCRAVIDNRKAIKIILEQTNHPATRIVDLTENFVAPATLYSKLIECGIFSFDAFMMSTPASVTATGVSAREEVTKPIHTILLDTSPLLLNTPSISTLLANGHVLVTTPSVLAEVKGQEARSRIETLYMPFMTVRSPKPESMKFVKDFAKKTGDAAVLSQTDYEVLALAYDLECERNAGDWRLRRVPGQKRVNGSPPIRQDAQKESVKATNLNESRRILNDLMYTADMVFQSAPPSTNASSWSSTATALDVHFVDPAASEPAADTEAGLQAPEKSETQMEPAGVLVTEEPSSDSDEGWITPSNIKKRQAKDEAASASTKNEPKTLQVATMTGDFAMQNVLLQMNLNLLSTKTCKRIANIKQMILRCHGCFATTKDMSKQFCARCGKPTMTRVSCTTNDKGEVKLHLKANMQWNNKGNVFSIPKPTAGTANQEWKGAKQGGGQGGWGNDLILAEDQKEYVRSMSTMKRTKDKNLMDEDLLPSILTGDRNNSGGRVRVGGGRNINSRKR